VNTASELVPPTAAPAARPAAAGPAPAQRQRNARGQGARLTEDIVTGALALIERSGSDEAVTLRAGDGLEKRFARSHPKRKGRLEKTIIRPGA